MAMQKRFLKDDCGCGGSVLGRRFIVYSFSSPDSSLVTATKRVHMKVDKVSTLKVVSDSQGLHCQHILP